MAQTYEQWKQSYESMDKAQKQQYADLLKTKSSDYIGNQYATRYAGEKWGKTATTPTTSTETTSTTPTPNIAKPEYQWTWTSGAKWSTYTNQWEGNFTYNPKSWYYEKTTNVETPKIETPKAANQELANFWNNLSYEQQQNYLNQNPNLKQSVVSKWLTIKQPEATPTTPTTPTTPEETPKQWEWDYQDDSPERMAEIAQNLEMYKQTMPYLFSDKKAFDDFFINWKGRSQAQIDFLNQWFDNNQKYGKYDALTPESIWAWIAYWDIPEDYLTMLKTTDPAKYMAVLQAKQDAEDKIKDKTALDTTSFLSWEDEATITSKAIEWLKSQWLFLDNDWNLIDDRTENYATDEEKQYAKDAADIIARNLDIDNTVKHTYDDLVEKYPWATKATLMAMAQDINSDLLREKENNNVELTRLQWYMDYMQSERQERTRIWENAINQLQKQYGMYYQYSPEWMSELAQAQYAATNVTLDQADYGTDTQKQMALDAVLTPIYQQYGDIIQRPQAQVINDVMALAKNKGIGLSQALEENFMKYLKEKPAYQTMQSQMNATWLKREKVGKDANWNDIYWFVDLANKTVSPYWAIWGWVSSATANTYTVEEVSSNRDKRVSAMRDIANQYDTLWDMAEWIAYNMEWVGWGNLECWQYVNDYINAVTWSKWQYGNLVSQKASLAPNKDWDSIQVWDVVVFDYNKNTPQWVLNSPQKEDLLKYWHVWFVTGINPDWSINMSHTNWWVVENTVVKPWSSFYNSFAGSQHINKSQSLWKWFNEQLTNEYLAFIQAAWKPADQKKIAEWLWLSVEEMREQSNKYSWQQTADTYFDMLGRINNILSLAESWDLPSFAIRKNAQSEWFFWGLATRGQDVSDWKADNDKIVDTLSLDSLINLKWRWATFWALSDSEREAIGRYATALWSPMSDAKYINELKQLRAKLIESSHWYLWDLTSYWQNQSYMGNQSYDWTAWI